MSRPRTPTPLMAVKRMTGTTRQNSSRNGNPRWRVHFDDATSALTAVDSAVAYGINNREHYDNPVEVTYDLRGHITGIQPVNEEDAS